MKKHFLLLASVMAGFTVFTASAQQQGPGGPPPGPSWDGALAKLFGDNGGFTATMEFHFNRASGQEMTMPGKMAHLEGKARFEMDLTKMQGGRIPPQALERMKQMGMDKMFSITRRDQNLVYIVYPDMKAYTEMPIPEKNVPVSDYKSDITKLGGDTVGSYDCTKNKVVVTGPDGVTHEFTVWTATDLKGFPVKIQFKTKEGNDMTMQFSDVKLEKPDAALFEPPTDCTKYDNMMSLMMSRARGGAPPQ
ncbi:MAG TPA: DUF4412 domain-containing protein [Verrucomicrobiae bacterium]|nr:DUF4412 domain-containing protein [Verrucomicrobiae bacterium]